MRAPRRDELDAVLALMRAHDTAAWGGSDWTRDDLAEYWDELDLGQDTRVVELNDRLVGYVDFESRGSGRLIADGYVDPATRGRGVGSALAEAVEARAALELEHTTGRVFLQYGALRAEAGSEEFFRRRGYDDVRHQWRMVIDLEGPPVARPPVGVEIRPSGPERSGRSTPQSRRRGRSEAGCTSRARTRNGRARCSAGPATTRRSISWQRRTVRSAASLCATRTQRRLGLGRPLGVRPAWRRRGIGEALLRHAFAEFFRLGERTVALQVDAQSPTGATRLYERAGMRVLYEVVVWEKELRAA